jgi:hypothetical protein
MDEFKKISSSEWGTPYEGSSTDPLSSIAQRDGNNSVSAILARDAERKIQGADIQDEVAESLDDKPA